MVLQRFENASDGEAGDRVAFDLRWEYAAGVDLDYRGSVRTGLVGMQGRLRQSKRPQIPRRIEMQGFPPRRRCHRARARCVLSPTFR